MSKPKILVDSDSLFTILDAVRPGAPGHYLRELQATMSLSMKMGHPTAIPIGPSAVVRMNLRPSLLKLIRRPQSKKIPKPLLLRPINLSSQTDLKPLRIQHQQ